MSTTGPVSSDHVEGQPVDEEQYDSWDAFWAEVLDTAPTVTIRGVRVRTPRDLPMGFDQKLRVARNAGDEATYKGLLVDLFGVDVLDAWTAAGMGEIEFQVVLAWGYANGKNQPVTFQQAYELVRARQEAARGKAPTQETTTGTNSTSKSEGSDDSGPSSKPTSGANTSSPRARSRR